MNVEIKILDPRLPGWGFPRWGSQWAAGLDLHACIDKPLSILPQVPPTLVSTGMAFRIGDPEWCGLIFPRSGLAHRDGLVLGNTVGVVDADFDGPCMISVWNRNNPVHSGATGPSNSSVTINPGDRIAQLVFTRIARPSVAIVERFSQRSPRGSAGYGSTGVD
jgi:dUTP pyrophosphatase